MTGLWVVLGGIIGVLLRHGLDRVAAADRDTGSPWRSTGVNVAGSLVIGVLIGAAVAVGRAQDAGTAAASAALLTYTVCGQPMIRVFAAGPSTRSAIHLAADILIGLVAATAGVVLGATTFG